MEGLKNIMEEAVEYQLKKILPTMPNICSCEECQMDMATYALNRLKPQYVRTDTGALYQKLHNSSRQAEVEILTTVAKAIEIIGAQPHHSKKDAGEKGTSENAANEEDKTEENNTEEKKEE